MVQVAGCGQGKDKLAARPQVQGELQGAGGRFQVGGYRLLNTLEHFLIHSAGGPTTFVPQESGRRLWSR